MALDRLLEAEDVLQICCWYQGEGFGDRFKLARDGNSFVFTEAGKKKAGRMFFETFTGFQQPSHSECNAGCRDGEDECQDPSHDHLHDHHTQG